MFQAKDPKSGNIYVVAESLLGNVPGAVATKKKGKEAKGGFEILAKMKGKELLGLEYVPLFDYFASLKSRGAFKVVGDAYVTSESGTGIVHQAPAFGEDDYRVCINYGIIEKGGFLPCPVDDTGSFTEVVSDFAGM